MEGEIKQFDSDRQQGTLEDEEGRIRSFPASELRGGLEPVPGRQIAFEPVDDDKASHLWLSRYAVQGTEKVYSKTMALLLAFLGGGLGAHKFYLGAWGWGILYALLLPTGVSVVVAFAEGIRYIIMDEERFRAKTAAARGAFTFIW
ncbi:MAG: NINE protein [Magnetococcales bacterium]|nr:NINE protein [Magnetococcales bacterium]